MCIILHLQCVGGYESIDSVLKQKQELDKYILITNQDIINNVHVYNINIKTKICIFKNIFVNSIAHNHCCISYNKLRSIVNINIVPNCISDQRITCFLHIQCALNSHKTCSKGICWYKTNDIQHWFMIGSNIFPFQIRWYNGTWKEKYTDDIEIQNFDISYDSQGNFFDLDTNLLYVGIPYKVYMQLDVRGDTFYYDFPDRWDFVVGESYDTEDTNPSSMAKRTRDANYDYGLL